MRTADRYGGRSVLVAGLCVWGIWESVYGLSQVLGWRSSRHALYVLTGHFQNPGPFGGFIACVMAVAGAWLLHSQLKSKSTVHHIIIRFTTVLTWVALAIGLLVLPASMSRAGWLGLVVALGIESLRQTKVRGWMRTHRWAFPVTVIASIMLLAGAFILKPDSALGRFHIWRMECRAIAERPWTGAGPGMGPWAYGEAQESFFREHLETVSPAVVRVAGCPEYSFNEFLGLGVEYGAPALLLSVLLVVSSILVFHRAKSPLAAGLTAWSVFAFASYPLSVKQLRILGAVFILGTIVTGALQIAARQCRQENRGHPRLRKREGPTPKGVGGMSEAKFSGGSRLRLAGLLPVLCAALLLGWMYAGGFKPGMTDRELFRELYAEGYYLHQMGRYEESTKVLEKGARLSCDPMFEIIMGKNAEALGDLDRATELYEKAHYMVPSRLYPMVRLMRLQMRQGSDEAALETAREIVSMPVNERNAGMARLHKETQVTLDSLTSILRTDG